MFKKTMKILKKLFLLKIKIPARAEQLVQRSGTDRVDNIWNVSDAKERKKETLRYRIRE